MGRKIKGKKHLGVKDPFKQQEIRNAKLKNKINAPPSVIDFQEVPKSAERLLLMSQACRNRPIQKRRKKKRGSKNTLIDTDTLLGKETILPGMTKPDKPVPTLVQLPKESDSHFLYRVGSACHQVVQEAKFEDKYGVDVKKDPVTGEITLQKKSKADLEEEGNQSYKSRQKKQKSNKNLEEISATKKERRKQKLKEIKKTKLEKHVDEFARFKDEVKFGEVVHAPPTFTALPKKAKKPDGAPKPGTRNLLLKSALQMNTESFSTTTKKVKHKDLPAATKRQLELHRQQAVEAYRMMKARK